MVASEVVDSAVEELPTGEANSRKGRPLPICRAGLRAGPTVVVTVADERGDPMPGIPVYVFDGPTYTGRSGTTDAHRDRLPGRRRQAGEDPAGADVLSAARPGWCCRDGGRRGCPAAGRVAERIQARSPRRTVAHELPTGSEVSYPRPLRWLREFALEAEKTPAMVIQWAIAGVQVIDKVCASPAFTPVPPTDLGATLQLPESPARSW